MFSFPYIFYWGLPNPPEEGLSVIAEVLEEDVCISFIYSEDLSPLYLITLTSF